MDFSVVHYERFKEIPEDIHNFIFKNKVINFEISSCFEELLENPLKYGEKFECIAVCNEKKIVLMTFRAPTYNLLISNIDSVETVNLLVKFMVESGINIPGIFGPVHIVEIFIKSWTELTEEEFQTSDVSLVFCLDTLSYDYTHNGRLMIADYFHQKRLIQWSTDSILELIPESPDLFIQKSKDNLIDRIKEKNVFVLEENQDLVSTASISGKFEGFQINYIVYTPPNQRRKGFAAELCTKLCHNIITRDKNAAILTVLESNLPAINLYKKIGFSQIGKVTLALKEI